MSNNGERPITIHRAKPKTDFTIIPNAVVQNPSLSFAARGLLAYLLSLPVTWEVRMEHLREHGTLGTCALRKTMGELARAGHLHRFALPGGAPGQFGGSRWHVFADPAELAAFLSAPHRPCGFPTVGAPADVQKGRIREKDTEKKDKKDKTARPPVGPVAMNETDSKPSPPPPAVRSTPRLTAIPTEAVVIPSLPLSDQRYLDDRERLIEAGLKSSIMAAKALHEIKSYKHGKLWKTQYDSFSDYCQDRWGYAKTHAYQLVMSGEVLQELESHAVQQSSAIAEWMPKNESHIRPLLKLQPGKRGECWKYVLIQMKPGEVSARIVKAELLKFAKAQGLPLTDKKAKPKMPPGKKAAVALKKLQAAIISLPNADEIADLLERVKDLLAS